MKFTRRNLPETFSPITVCSVQQPSARPVCQAASSLTDSSFGSTHILPSICDTVRGVLMSVCSTALQLHTEHTVTVTTPHQPHSTVALTGPSSTVSITTQGSRPHLDISQLTAHSSQLTAHITSAIVGHVTEHSD
jgi:uncharacterized lipoprotein YajG